MSSEASSSPDRIDRLEARLDRLERIVRELQETVEAPTAADSDPPSSPDPSDDPAGTTSSEPDDPKPDDPARPEAASPPDPEAPSTSDSPPSKREAASTSGAAAADPAREQTGWSRLPLASLRSEDWLSYVGIALLLFGLAFLFKYSIEQGWLVPAVRVGFGALTGSVLLGAGLRIYAERRQLRQILLGGSSATFYGTVFAAYQLYGLVSSPVAFGSMGAVTVVSIALALQQDHASMAVIGTVGGLGTPFLLYGDVGAVGGFTVYTCLVLVGASAVYLVRGWQSVLYTAVVGGWGVLLVPCADAALSSSRPDGAGVLQGGLVAAWLLLGGTPVLRAILRLRRPGRWPQPQTGVVKLSRALFGDRPAYGLVTSSPFVALFASRLLWTGSDLLWAVVAAIGALGYGAAYRGLRRVPLPRYAPAHALVSAVLAAYGLSEALGGATLLVAWAVEALLLLVLARRLDDTTLRRSGHVLFGVVAGWLGSRFLTVSPSPALPLVSPAALSEFVALALGAVALQWTRGRHLRGVYRGALIVGWFGWWAHALLPLPQGPTYLLLVASLSATGLLALARNGGDALFRVAGHATFAVLAGALAVRWLTLDPNSLPLLGLAPLMELAVLGLGLALAHRLGPGTARRLYRGGGLAGWLAWGAHELIPLAHGQAYVSLAWGLTAAALLTGGAWRRHEAAQKAGLATLALFVGKLFLVDLATLPALWRIALFLGAGGGFLLVSYALPGLGDDGPDETSP